MGEMVAAWREMLLSDESEALRNLDDAERQSVRNAFDIGVGSIFDCAEAAIPEVPQDPATGVSAIVSPANSFGDMTGGIDKVYLNRWGDGLQDRLQDLIRREKDEELVVGDALVIETSATDPVRYCISAP